MTSVYARRGHIAGRDLGQDRAWYLHSLTWGILPRDKVLVKWGKFSFCVNTKRCSKRNLSLKDVGGSPKMPRARWGSYPPGTSKSTATAARPGPRLKHNSSARASPARNGLARPAQARVGQGYIGLRPRTPSGCARRKPAQVHLP